MPRISDNTLVTRGGSALPLRYWPATTEKASAVIIALHSFTDYSGAFDALGPWFAARGNHVYAYDQRGFGAAPQAGAWPGSKALVNDLVDAMAAIANEHNEPIFIFGESMGGSVALLASAQLKPQQAAAGLVLAAPGVREDLPLRPMWDLLLWGADKLLPWASVAVHDEANPRLNSNSNQRLQYDPMVQRRVRADTYYGVIQLADAASAAAADIQVPVLLLHGGADELVHRRSICAAQQAMAPASTLKLYADAPHLLLHWQQHQRVWADIDLWLQQPDAIASDKACDNL